MSNRADQNHAPAVIFFGMPCAFSIPPLKAIIAAGLDVRAVVLPGPKASTVRLISNEVRPRVLPLAMATETIDSVAWNAGIPIITTGSMHDPAFLEVLSAHQPDVIAVACFPWLIPQSVRAIPRFGGINLHPSLLPRWRGPEPLLWTLLSGDANTGVTIHLLHDGFDTGPILAQQQLPVPAGIDGKELEQELAIQGGQLLARVIGEHVAGATIPKIQNESLATLARLPEEDDLLLHSNRPAVELFNIIRGVTPIWGSMRLQIDPTGAEFTVLQALDFNMTDYPQTPQTLVQDVLYVRCNAGSITLRIRN